MPNHNQTSSFNKITILTNIGVILERCVAGVILPFPIMIEANLSTIINSRPTKKSIASSGTISISPIRIADLLS